MMTLEDYQDYTEFHEEDTNNVFYCRLILENIIGESKKKEVNLNPLCYDTLIKYHCIVDGLYKGVKVNRV